MQSNPSRPILIIDDDEDAHILLKHALAKLGIHATTISAYSGVEGVGYLRDSLAGKVPSPALVFLDVKMPGMDGFKVLEWMREKELLGQFTLTMLTSSDETTDIARAMTLGAHTFMTKPAEPNVLSGLIAAALH